MALRNIINMPVQHHHHHQPIYSSVPVRCVKTGLASTKQLVMPTTNSSTASSSSSNSTSSGASSIQIRTSSPISSSDSEYSGPANSVISPSKFISAVHQSRRGQVNSRPCGQHAVISKPKPAQPQLKNYASIKQLAFDKLRQQQAGEMHPMKSESKLPFKSEEKNKLKSMGKLKIAVYNNLTHMTVYVVAGQSYKLVDMNHHEPTYVRLNILPDQDRAFCNIRTRTVKPTSQPLPVKKSTASLASTTTRQQYVYDSKFSFELDQLNEPNARLLVSVWSAKLEKLIGCFSFKLKHLLQQKVASNPYQQSRPKPVWYHLLPYQYGLSKSMKCTVRSRPGGSTHDEVENGVVDHPTHVNKDLIGMNRLTIVLEKSDSESSYGFTITSSCPCMVGKVDIDKPAFRHGLRPGDFISKINGLNVSRASTESVVKMIKGSRSKLNIEVYRQQDHLLHDIYQSSSSLNSQRRVQPQMTSKPTVSDLKPFKCFGLEAVPEEEEDDPRYDNVKCGDEDEDVADDLDDSESMLLQADDEEFNGDYEEVEQRLNANSGTAAPSNRSFEELDFFKAQSSIRYVDSMTSNELEREEERVADQMADQLRLNESDDQSNDEKAADELRRATLQYYAATDLSKQASIRSLNKEKAVYATKLSLSNFNQNI